MGVIIFLSQLKFLTEREIKMSKSLANILRHKCVELGIDVDGNGWVTLNDLIDFSTRTGLHKAAKKTAENLLGLNEESLRRIIEIDSKSRFEARKEGQFAIRACQGHSIVGLDIDSQKLIPESELDDLKVFHGTTCEAWAEISTKGLSRMGRQHIHFASGFQGQEKSGMRKGSKRIIEINTAKVRSLGGKFFRSTNGVILCAGIPDGEGGYDPIPVECFSVCHRR